MSPALAGRFFTTEPPGKPQTPKGPVYTQGPEWEGGMPSREPGRTDVPTWHPLWEMWAVMPSTLHTVGNSTQ